MFKMFFSNKVFWHLASLQIGVTNLIVDVSHILSCVKVVWCKIENNIRITWSFTPFNIWFIIENNSTIQMVLHSSICQHGNSFWCMIISNKWTDKVPHAETCGILVTQLIFSFCFISFLPCCSLMDFCHTFSKKFLLRKIYHRYLCLFLPDTWVYYAISETLH